MCVLAYVCEHCAYVYMHVCMCIHVRFLLKLKEGKLGVEENNRITNKSWGRRGKRGREGSEGEGEDGGGNEGEGGGEGGNEEEGEGEEGRE